MALAASNLPHFTEGLEAEDEVYLQGFAYKGCTYKLGVVECCSAVESW